MDIKKETLNRINAIFQALGTIRVSGRTDVTNMTAIFETLTAVYNDLNSCTITKDETEQ